MSRTLSHPGGYVRMQGDCTSSCGSWVACRCRGAEFFWKWVLQWVAVSSSDLQCVAASCSELQCDAVRSLADAVALRFCWIACCRMLQWVAVVYTHILTHWHTHTQIHSLSRSLLHTHIHVDFTPDPDPERHRHRLYTWQQPQHELFCENYHPFWASPW